MFLEKFIPSAYAQTIGQQIKTTAIAGEQAAVEGTTSGLQQLLLFIVNNIDNWIAGIVILFFTWILAKMAANTIKNAIIKKKGEEIQESILILVERVTKTIVIIVGVTIAAAVNGFNFTAVIGALSLGIGFALKDIIGTFISSIILLSQDRIKIGDLIKIGDILGTIISIDTRVTVLQAIDGTEVVIPNSEMLNQTLISFSTNPFRRVELVVGVDYNTDLPMVTSLIKGIIEKDHDIVPKPESLVLVDQFGDSSINIKIFFWIESHKNWLKIRSNLAHRIKKTFNELGISIPFPIRTLKLDEDDRSFLKTMDSMKKGYVPEKKQAPALEKIITAAEDTENAPQVPEEIFEKQTVQSTPSVTSAVPAAIHAAAPAEPKTTEKPELQPPPAPATPPPTHL